MTEKKEEKPPTLLQIENNVEIANTSLRTALTTPLGELPEWQKQMQLEQAIKNTILELQGALHDLELRHPMVVVTKEYVEHACDTCMVTRHNLDPDDHCDGCANEGQLISWIPRVLRYADATEVSMEDDEPSYSDPTEVSTEEDKLL